MQILKLIRDSFGKKIYFVVIALLLLPGTFVAGYYVAVDKTPSADKVIAFINKEKEKPVHVDFETFWKAWNLLNEKYVPTTGSSTEPITDQDKLYGAIQGLTDSLGDPYTVFFPPEEAKEFATEIRGNFEGVGMEIGIKDGILTVVAPIKGSPSFKAGIKAGDKIRKIGDVSTAGLSTDKAVKLIRGPKGTPVVVNIVREGVKEPFDITLVRDVINLPTIDTELRKDGVFVIKLHSFSENSAKLFRDALKTFLAAKTNKMILDLRGNPGGYLESAVSMASWFLPKGEVVVREDFGKGRAEEAYRSAGYNIFTNKLKMMILVDGGSASASEILAGALREHGIAKLVGTKTFGKGSVQELVKLTPDTSLKITIARWLTPKGLSISKEGLKPDYEVKIDAKDPKVVKGVDVQMEKAVELLLK